MLDMVGLDYLKGFCLVSKSLLFLPDSSVPIHTSTPGSPGQCLSGARCAGQMGAGGL